MVCSRRSTGERHAERGAALVDSIIGAILLGIALAAALGLVGRAISSQDGGHRLATAAALADEQLALVLARGPDDYAKQFPIEGACEAPFQEYQFKVELSGGSDREPYLVRVTISYLAGSRPQSVVVETLMASRSSGGVEPDPERAPQEPVERLQ